jgi:sigma-B regulation protein RsbU (phosphoserine phosphatase)
MNTVFEEFGESRLEATLMGCSGKSCQEMIDAVSSDVKSFVGDAEQSDDITMLVLKRL